MRAPTAIQAFRRFLLLKTLRWLPTGLQIPVIVLFLTDRGYSLGQIGLLIAVQGVAVFLLELPTGGLADAFSRRAVLLGGSTAHACFVSVLILADSMALMAAAFALQGISRALDSGALDAWYVDAAQAADSGADIERGLSWGATALGIAMALGSLISGGVVALATTSASAGDVDALVLPLLVSLGLEIVHFGAIATLMTDARRRHTHAPLRQSVQATPAAIGKATRLVWSSTALLALVSVELLWGFGMIAFEVYTPIKLSLVLGDPDQAAALFGPVSAAAWGILAAGAALVPQLTRWVPPIYAGATMRLAQGAAVVGIGIATGPAGVMIAYLITMGVHGAANPVHDGLLHRAVDGPDHRATVVSANSMTGQIGGALGGIALGAIAGATTVNIALVVGAAVLAAAAPLYFFVRTPAPLPEPVAVSASAVE